MHDPGRDMRDDLCCVRSSTDAYLPEFSARVRTACPDRPPASDDPPLSSLVLLGDLCAYPQLLYRVLSPGIGTDVNQRFIRSGASTTVSYCGCLQRLMDRFTFSGITDQVCD
jgi:hypothetical protein